LNAFDRALQQIDNEQRADFIEDVAMGMWGGKNTDKRVRALRGKR